MSSQAEAQEVRHLAIQDGRTQHHVVVSVGMRVQDILVAAGVRVTPAIRVVQAASGARVRMSDLAQRLQDGDALSVIDTTAPLLAPSKAKARRRRVSERPAPVAAWWMLGVVGALVGFLLPFVHTAVPAHLSIIASLGFAIAAVLVGIYMVRGEATAQVAGVAAGLLAPVTVLLVAVASLTSAQGFSPTVQVATSAATAALAFGLWGVLAVNEPTSGRLNALCTIAIVVAVINVLAALYQLPLSAAAAVIVGAVPLALRVVPTTLMNVPPGAFIDFEEHQQTRWAVREQLPESITKVDAKRVQRLVERARARMDASCSALAGLALASAWFALNPIRTVNAFELSGQIALAVCVVLALSLTARRYVSRRLRWTIRGCGAGVALVAVVSAAQIASLDVVLLSAAGALIVSVLVAAMVSLVAKGVRSLSWSRFADIIEAIAVAFALPAGLLAAGVVDLIRGM